MCAKTPGACSLPQSLQHVTIETLPSTAYYIPDFISEEEERAILEKVCRLSWLSRQVYGAEY